MIGILQMHDIYSARSLKIPWPDVYHTPEYAEADLKTQGNGTAWELTVWRPVTGAGAIVYGYYKRPVLYHGAVAGHDICTPYGYAAPFATESLSVELWAAFRSDFEEMCVEHTYVAEFVRFNPLKAVDMQGFMAGCVRLNSNFKCRLHQITVGIDLKQYWTKASTRHRTATRKAQKLGYVTDIRSATLDDFHDRSPFYRLYGETMKRLEAKEFYFFSIDYFQTLCTALEGKVFIATVQTPIDNGLPQQRYEEKYGMAAAALFLLHGTNFHYHLAGSEKLHAKNGVNNLLQDAAAKYAYEKLGCNILHLGGGQTKGDSLFSFKRSIGNLEFDCHVGSSVLHNSCYERFVALRAAHLGCTSADLLQTSKFHPAYRDGIAHDELAS